MLQNNNKKSDTFLVTMPLYLIISISAEFTSTFKYYLEYEKQATYFWMIHEINKYVYNRYDIA